MVNTTMHSIVCVFKYLLHNAVSTRGSDLSYTNNRHFTRIPLFFKTDPLLHFLCSYHHVKSQFELFEAVDKLEIFKTKTRVKRVAFVLSHAYDASL